MYSLTHLSLLFPFILSLPLIPRIDHSCYTRHYLCTLYVFSLTFLIFSIRTIFHSPSYLYSVTHLYRIPWHLLRLSSLTVSLNHEVKVGRVVGEEKKSCFPVYSILCIFALTFCTLPQSFCIHYPQCLYQFLFSLSIPLLYTSILLPSPVYVLNYLHCTLPLESVVKISLSLSPVPVQYISLHFLHFSYRSPLPVNFPFCLFCIRRLAGPHYTTLLTGKNYATFILLPCVSFAFSHKFQPAPPPPIPRPRFQKKVQYTVPSQVPLPQSPVE